VDRTLEQVRHDEERIVRDVECVTHVVATHEDGHRFRGPRSSPPMERWAALAKSLFALRKAFDHTARSFRRRAPRKELGSGVAEHMGYLAAVFAALTAGVTPRACPRRRRMLFVDGHIPSRGEVRHAHLAPGCDGLARLDLRHRTRRSAQLRAVHALLERANVRGEQRQPKRSHGFGVYALGDAAVRGFFLVP